MEFSALAKLRLKYGVMEQGITLDYFVVLGFSVSLELVNFTFL